MERVRCKAIAKTTHERCRKTAILGGTVCREHGGAAPQVQRKALERIREARDLATETFLRQLGEDIVNPSTALAAMRDLTKTIADEHERETGAKTASVIDDWLDDLKARR